MKLLWSLLKVGLVLVGMTVVAGLSAFLTIQYLTSTDSVAVPPIVGLSATDAVKKLDEAGLRIQFEEDEKNRFDESIPADHVLRQQPEAGSRLKRDRKVKVVLSLGPRNLYVPRVIGEALNAAQVRLQQAGLRVGSIAYSPSASVENTVIDQQTVAMAGGEGAVNLLTSEGLRQDSFVMPDLIGQQALRIRARLELRGFRVVQQVELYDGLPDGTIVRQKPLAGYPVRSGDAMWLWVSQSRPGEGF